ncbi:MAG: hypothetical protein M0Z94_15615 [Dehalococcoidales bacterium]|nr:hypothetical protein [Dehalococcoidales bacterium]
MGAAYRLLLDKAALLTITPEPTFAPDDRRRRRRFAEWLGRRFDREPLPDDIVEALQRPILKAIRALSQLDDKRRLIDSIKEVRFYHERNAEGTLEVELLLFPEDEGGINAEGALVVAGWFDGVLRDAGRAHLNSPT